MIIIDYINIDEIKSRKETRIGMNAASQTVAKPVGQAELIPEKLEFIPQLKTKIPFKQQWECRNCTFLNSPVKKTCQLCYELLG